MTIEDDIIKQEEIERRREVRGVFHGLKLILAPEGKVYEVEEASMKAFFIVLDNPDQYALGESREATVTRGEGRVHCRLEVIRKEIQPRRGVALRILHIDPRNEQSLKTILGIT
jgi:hypothetical protein